MNPWNIHDVARAIHKALTMSAHERAAHHNLLYKYINRHTAAQWGLAFVTELNVGYDPGCAQPRHVLPTGSHAFARP